mmetsp:Transcript_18283/g.26691  ORF Transcript_18283/g.26691 Transcript_18283/m.26691 type:complete len:289 (+) Transcript_18283:416-1282(+)|eukprot:CAMPEP_0185021710 /NCGR_PEP_ID=MMETSP1103-20130426/4410_1 /TAXON_ID=36769 /ORGANISM="Paraphysomonas bandaiensis, Strain Caron Lab Isolate" /LENGTH=288 /DNA_ID=CAMNT_0027553405 /DNA_START=344 /DNA_END=1210 /DNA_ORIENTATION=-
MLDTSDFDSVIEFATWYRAKHNTLTYLVNNAGILYLTEKVGTCPDNPLRSKQGYDLAFATNYLGHFLLTELLLPLLKKSNDARIVQVASSAHYQVDGSELRTDGTSPPIASRSDVYTLSHWVNSYGNNKLAQILHATQLQRIINSEAHCRPPNLKVVSVCPGFVGSNMVPKGPIGKFLAARFFSCEASVLCVMHALFSESILGGEFITNFYDFWTDSLLGRTIFDLAVLCGLRSIFMASIAVPWVMTFQHCTYGVHTSTPSSAARDENLAECLYAWSMKQIETYRHSQ